MDMRRIFFLVVTTFFIQTEVSSQTCLPEGIYFGHQLSINSFQTDYPNCTEIEGDVEIHTQLIDNLNGLSNLTRIGGDLKISGSSPNPEFVNLDGLNNLKSIGKDFTLNVYHSLSDITALENLTTVGGDLKIGSNSALQYLTGLENLTSIGGSLSIRDNTSLKSLTVFENLTSIDGDIDIYYNTSLNSLSGLENIDNFSVSNLSITFNNNLSTCDNEVICNYLENPNGIVLIHTNAPGCNNSAEVVSDCGVNLPCLTYGNYYFSNQAEIDNFQSNYPNCIVIEGDVIIDDYGSDITNLIGLSQITSISGNLIIKENYSLPGLEGLENLKTIGGDLNLVNNKIISSLAGFENLETIGGSFIFHNSDSLVDFTGLGNLKSISNYFQVLSNNSLINFIGLESLKSIKGLWVHFNHSLTNFNGLEGLQSVQESIQIYSNNMLTGLDGLENIEPESIFDLQITNNKILYSCECGGICNYLVNPTGTILIFNNAEGCNSPVEVAEQCNISLPCLPYGDYLFKTQNEIDNFQTDYQDCAEIKGNVTIEGEDITNLSGLSIVESIEGNLSFGGGTDTTITSSLNSLDGLNNLRFVGGNVNVYDQDNLTDFTGLENLETINGFLSISYNYLLTSLSGIDNLTSLGGSLSITNNNSLSTLESIENIDATTITNLWISENPSLSYCNAKSVCDYLVSPNGHTFIYNNDEGCRGKREVMDSCGIVFCLPGGITFLAQSEIENFQTNHPNCDIIDGTVRISGDNITDLSFLSSLTSVNGNLEIYDNDQLENLYGLSNITSVTGSLIVGSIGRGGNNSLTSLTGLGKLRVIGGDIRILNNTVLNDITSLENINSTTINGLNISNNPVLSTCSIVSICDYLNNLSGEVDINNNAIGCSNETEILAECTAWIPKPNAKPQFTIFPNPAKKTISITQKNESTIDEINMYNQLGQMVLHKNRINKNINVSILEQGLYIIEIVSNDLRFRQKLIIQE